MFEYKVIYVVEEQVENGDEDDFFITYDREEAVKKGEYLYAHLTEKEREKITVAVAGYNVKCENGVSAKDAYHDYLLEGDYTDPVEYISIRAMHFSELLEKTGMTMVELSERFGIPYRTVQNWKSGVRDCPSYVVTMMRELLEV